MKQDLAFECMKAVKEEYVKAKLTDTQFAEMLSQRFKAPITRAQVTQWRGVFNIPKTGPKQWTLEQQSKILELLRNYRLTVNVTTEIDNFIRELEA